MARPIRLVTVLAVLVLAAGCSSDDGAADEPTRTAAASTTTEATTTTAAPVVEVAFNGDECSVTPSSVQAGETAFLVTNTSDVALDSNSFFVVMVPEAYTFQDLVDIQVENGGPPKSIPANIWYTTLDIQNEAISFGAPPDIALNEDQSLHLRTLTPGTDAIELYVEEPEELQWLCGPLEVTTGS